ncbi:aurora kinase A and ninein-interacting protein isoform X2 [Brienomyrus brachyistius]|nr:aurora kinase A and ninein-interacting protein isoform X2 [Brienomyrus brachyistius]XP_048850005.1 aurora kinase A and ninein-interacting protein isoform X2 [Brienomyrus brachyistius]
MKPTKKAAMGSEDVCGVWLDTADLRGRRKRSSLKQPISKLLNPLAPCPAYSVAVSLSFTQTKLQLPPTRQTSITSFFNPWPTEAKAVESSCSEHMSGSSTAVSERRKRKRSTAEADCDPRATDHSDPQDRPACQDIRPCVWAAPERLALLDTKCQSDEEDQPAVKKRLAGRRPLLPEPDTQDAAPCRGFSSAAAASEPREPPLSDCFTQDSRGNCVLGHRVTTGDGGFPDSLESEWLFGALLSHADRTSTQRRHGGSPRRALREEPGEQGKENSSAPAWTQGLSPVKRRSCSSPCSPLRRWEVSCPSPRRYAPRSLQEDEENTYDMLFTQDSQGQRVIAHHGFEPRSPLKDWGNIANCRFRTGSSSTSAKENEDSELEPEILFTQDSEGNVVIKH